MRVCGCQFKKFLPKSKEDMTLWLMSAMCLYGYYAADKKIRLYVSIILRY